VEPLCPDFVIASLSDINIIFLKQNLNGAAGIPFYCIYFYAPIFLSLGTPLVDGWNSSVCDFLYTLLFLPLVVYDYITIG
jgi:hypothetical protein